jgi:transcriptional regulator with XRE-family HTH domain
MAIDRIELARRLQADRRAVGLTLEAVAAHIACPPTTLREIEAGVRPINSVELAGLVRLYETTLADVLAMKPVEAIGLTGRRVRARRRHLRELRTILDAATGAATPPRAMMSWLATECWRRALISTGRAAELHGMDIATFRQRMAELGCYPELDDRPLLGAATL